MRRLPLSYTAPPLHHCSALAPVSATHRTYVLPRPPSDRLSYSLCLPCSCSASDSVSRQEIISNAFSLRSSVRCFSAPPTMLPNLVSLDHFRSRVYRQRIALLLLLILLGLQRYHHDSQSHDLLVEKQTPPQRDSSLAPKSGSQLQTPRLEASLLVVQTTSPEFSDAPSPQSLSQWAHRILNVFYAAPMISKDTRVELSRYSREPNDRSGHSSSRTTVKEAKKLLSPPAQPAGAPSFSEVHSRRAPHRAFSLHTLLLPSIFPTLAQLHGLWTIRFIAGEMEGRLSAKGKRIPFWSSLLALFTLTLAIPAVLSPTTRSNLQIWSMSQTSPVPATVQDASAGFNVFPSLLVLALEAIPTVLSLVPLFLVLAPRSIPTWVNLPSPSHAPSLPELLPLWIRAFMQPSERRRARQVAITSTRTRRHGVFGAPHSLSSFTGINSDTPISSVESDVPPLSPASLPASDGYDDVVSAQHGAEQLPSVAILSSSQLSSASHRLMHLQQDLIDEMEAAGKLGVSASRQARQRAIVAASSVRAGTQGKAPRRKDQMVSLPLAYVASLILMISSSISLVACYAAITLRLPNLAPTSLSAVVVLLALRAEIGTLARNWSLERRRIEGLEFVRRRWGRGRGLSPVSHDDRVDAQSNGLCAICLEAIEWNSGDEDGVRLDCSHELHAPCLVPWLMSQAFCPVCHRALRSASRKRSGRAATAPAVSSSGPEANAIRPTAVL